MQREHPEKRNPLARRLAVVLGRAPEPRWDNVDMVVGFAELGDCEGGIFLVEEETEHPEQIPLIALQQSDDKGFVCGEVWLSPADLPDLIAALTDQLDMNYATSRPWRGISGGPSINLDLPRKRGARDEGGP